MKFFTNKATNVQIEFIPEAIVFQGGGQRTIIATDCSLDPQYRQVQTERWAQMGWEISKIHEALGYWWLA